MDITVEYFSQIRAATGIDKETVSVAEGTTIQELILDISRLHGPRLASLIIDNGQISKTVLISRNDDLASDPAIALQPHDTITLFYPMSGG